MDKNTKKISGNKSTKGVLTGRVQDDKRTNDAYATQAISQPDRRQPKTGVAMPDDENVERARNWVDENSLS